VVTFIVERPLSSGTPCKTMKVCTLESSYQKWYIKKEKKKKFWLCVHIIFLTLYFCCQDQITMALEMAPVDNKETIELANK
jgi:hypothetical protein